MKGDEKMPKSQYLIESPHTKEECMAALDSIAQQGKNMLNKWDWGCMDGNHTGYALVEAQNENEALRQVPENIRNKAKVHKVTKFSSEEINAMHKA